MLISRVEEGMSAERRQEGDALEYQTASELFDIMAQNHPLDDVGEMLSTRDLVILYENIDLGTKLMANAEEYKLNRKPNQYVETIVYNEELDSDGSDCTDICSNDDLHNLVKINKERIDMLNTRPSLENTLCQKLGDLEIQASNLSFEYDQHFLFKDPYIKEQLKNLSHFGGDFEGSALPPSLLDYICCKRLEDNYNFYMDNIIRYVKHTIDQLKRISNGDYLTDRAKEKWREVEDVPRDADNSKVLATSTSIPLQVERKVNGLKTTWDDIIHSEVDIRSLSKILEKKIIVEVPKLICGSYKLFSKLCSDNLVISCKREKALPIENEKESRVDVVLQLGRSETGQVVSNISSIMILQPTPPVLTVSCAKILPLPFTQNEQEKAEKKKVQIIEIPEIKQEQSDGTSIDDSSDSNGAAKAFPNDTDDDINFFNESKNNSFQSSDTNIALKDILDTRAIPDILRKEAPYDFISPDDLSFSMHKLNMDCLPEESGEDSNVMYPVNKKKSQTKVRIKSPYENKSHAIEEKKRKKLLEIRERREKKKMAVSENCKITKHRYGKGAIMPQPSSSVTKLSITNKSFYNSIYGHNMNINMEKPPSNNKGRRSKRELSIDTSLDHLDGECESPMLTPEKNSKKYINRSYYLDEAVTEMMYTEMKPSECGSFREIFSGPPSATSADFNANLSVISQIVNLPEAEEVKTFHNNSYRFDDISEGKPTANDILFETSSRSILNAPAPTNSPKGEEDDNESSKKPLPSIECRKSIDKLYDLMKKIRKVDHLELKSSRSKLLPTVNKLDLRVGQDSSTIQGSESGTSLKHHLTSSNPSSFSFDKVHVPDDDIPVRLKSMSNKKTDALTTVVPKVIISSKQQTARVEAERPRKDRKKVAINPLIKVPDNPLKAISQLLHEFDSVQKTRHRPSTDPKPNKKPDTTLDRSGPRPGPPRRRPRFDQTGREREMKERDTRENDTVDVRHLKEFALKERKPKPNVAIEPLKIPHQQVPLEDKHFDRATKKKIIDILEEVKEAKGEAVRGPSKFNSRLNSLAQPKKSYVQAHSEEYQTRYGRTLMADRLQRLASSPQPGAPARGKPRRPGTEAVSSVSVRPPPVQPLERGRLRAGSAGPAPPDQPCNQRRDPDSPDTLKTKMVAVESYVKSHYGRSSPAAPDELLKARVPLLPADLDIVSVPSSPTGEESTTLGNKLHYMINSMINTNPSPLGALLEAHETSSKGSREKDDVVLISLPDYAHEHASSVDSDYRADIFEDKNVKTAVESFEDKADEPVAEVDSSKSFIDYEGESCNSSLEIQKLEEALNCRMSVTTFQNRVRIKNFTMTPKHSKQQVLVLGTGDVGSIVLKSSYSKSLKMSYSRSNEDVRSLANLVDPRLDWNFTNIPMQIATVGYAFPEYNPAFSGPSSAIKSLDNILNLDVSANVTNTKDKNSHKKCIESIPKARHSGAQEVSSMKDTEVEVSLTVTQNNKKEVTTVSIATDAYSDQIEKQCEIVPNFSSVKEVREDTENIQQKNENTDSTSSLDMLVGLLNEIQKITTYHMTNPEVYAEESDLKELGAILSKDGEMKKMLKNSGSRELVSIASLEKLRQLESNPSIYSLYLEDECKDPAANTIRMPKLSTSAKSVLCDSRPCCVDKEVSADFTVRDFTNTFTDVPSTFFPMTITTSTNITNSLLGILSKPSSQTVVCLHDYEDVDSTFTRDKKIIEITTETNHDEHHQPMIQYPKTPTVVTQTKSKEMVNKKASGSVRKLSTDIIAFSDQSKTCVKSCDFDPMIKMKRDILVTVYSMLVLTVFAALSFPEIMYHV